MRRALQEIQMRVFFSILIAALLFSCEKTVEINNPYPVGEEYCVAETQLTGEWISDSVLIQTDVDTIDSTISEAAPTVIYYLTIACDESSSLILRYYNYAGVETVDINSSNFEAQDGVIRIFNPADTQHQNVEGELTYSLDNDVLELSFSQTPNEGQVTNYRVYMSRL